MKNKRDKVFFTLDSEIHKAFNEIVESKILDKSRLIESLIKEFIYKQSN